MCCSVSAEGVNEDFLTVIPIMCVTPPPPLCRFVGEVTRVDPTLLRSLVNSGYIPVVATVATDENGQALNVNADTAAGEVRHSMAQHSRARGTSIMLTAVYAHVQCRLWLCFSHSRHSHRLMGSHSRCVSHRL